MLKMGTPAPVIAGMDEAGRGALAGPVSAAACILPFALFRRRRPVRGWSPSRRRTPSDIIIADSKKLTPREREQELGHVNLPVSSDRMGPVHRPAPARLPIPDQALDHVKARLPRGTGVSTPYECVGLPFPASANPA